MSETRTTLCHARSRKWITGPTPSRSDCVPSRGVHLFSSALHHCHAFLALKRAWCGWCFGEQWFARAERWTSVILVVIWTLPGGPGRVRFLGRSGLNRRMSLFLFLVPFVLLFVRAVWSSKMPLARTPVILNLLDGPVGVDLAFHIVCTRFRLMRGYLLSGRLRFLVFFVCWIWLLMRPPGHGPVHLRLVSAAEIGFV